MQSGPCGLVNYFLVCGVSKRKGVAHVALKEYLETLMKDLSKMLSSESVVGEPITVGQVTIVPVVTVSFGFGTGGGEGKDEKQNGGNGAGGGAGGRITPTAFLVVNGDQVTLLPVEKKGNTVDRLIDTIPGLVDKLNLKFGKGKKDAPTESDTTDAADSEEIAVPVESTHTPE